MHASTQAGESPIEEFTALRGTWEPHGGSGKQVHGLQYIKLLVRKVVTIYHALDVAVGRRSGKRACDGSSGNDGGGGVLIWADEDVTFHRAPDERLLRFARGVDVGYVPFQASTSPTKNLCRTQETSNAVVHVMHMYYAHSIHPAGTASPSAL